MGVLSTTPHAGRDSGYCTTESQTRAKHQGRRVTRMGRQGVGDRSNLDN